MMNDFDDDLHVDLTPLIDVIFMLVIFFIMTMSFTIPSIDFELPKAESAQVSSKNTAFNIYVNNKGQFLYEKNIVTREELEILIKETKPESINLAIEKDAPSQYLIDIADLSRIYTQGRLSIAVTHALKENPND